MFKSIRWKITTTYLVLILFTMLLLGGTGLWFLEKYYLNNLQDHLFAEGQIIRELVKPYFQGEASVAEVDREVKKLGRQLAARITIIDRNGVVVGDSNEDIAAMENHLNRPEIREALAGKKGIATRYSTTVKTRMMYVAQPVYIEGKLAGFVRVALPLTNIQQTLGHLQKVLVAGFLLVALLAVLLSLNFARGITGPIEEITRAAREITRGDYEQYIYPDTEDEIGQLGRTINLMASTIKEKINEIARGKGELEAVLANMVNGVIVFDNLGRIMMVNPAAEKALHLPGDQVIGRHGLEALRNFQFDESLKEVLREGSVIVKEMAFIFPEERIFQVHLAPVWGQGRRFLGIVAVFHDITALRELEKMRTEFVANASHELQTPLTAIKGFAETLLDGAMANPETCAKFIGIINKEAERLSRLVDDLLDLAKIEAQKITLNFQPIDLRKFIPETVQRVMPRIEKHDLSLHTEVPENLSPVKGDPDWLAQVLYNLLDNSIKYTPAGGQITVRVREEDNRIRVQVADTGIGIPPQDLPRVFERFYRVDKARSRRFGGTGLGLAIVKHIVEAHGGKVEVESREGKGTVFSFTVLKS